jgi:antitoxin (DNA-binding transcriptional repressor) of toxin-antitoxin stability system
VSVPSIDLASEAPRLSELVDEAYVSGEVVLTRGGDAVAKIVPFRNARLPRRPGSERGLIHMADDFDATPECLRDYF